MYKKNFFDVVAFVTCRLDVYLRVMCRGKNGLRNKWIALSLIVPLLLIFIIFYTKTKSADEKFNCAFNGTPDDAAKIVRFETNCLNNYAEFKLERRNNFIVLNNYVMSLNRYNCEESVTYVTNGDYTFLKNLIQVVVRWQGPVSIALHAPGSDFNATVESIIYLRSCVPSVASFVTFHVYFNESYAPAPEEIPLPRTILEAKANCSLPAPYETAKKSDKFATKNKILYPINVGRNIARSMAETHFVLVSDIELYPSLNLIPQFLMLMAGCNEVIRDHEPAVFALQVFEIESNLQVPDDKMGIVKMLRDGQAVPFHRDICSQCHSVPNYDKWVDDDDYKDLRLFNKAKRVGRYYHWEPFYLGTKAEPPFDERLSWEGMSDKIVQAYTMCLKNYTFFVLNNAFLVHSPGIKKTADPIKKRQRQVFVNETDKFIKEAVVPQLLKTYGNKYRCEF